LVIRELIFDTELVQLFNIAYKALTTWKQKSTADNKISFIGELSDEIHNFIVVISPAIEVYRFIKMIQALD
jgi:hypothetical protein